MDRIKNSGFIKLHRSLLSNPVVMKDSDHLAVWIYLLLKATYTGDVDVMFGGERYKLRPGEFTTGRKEIADELKISESKVQRILKRFEIEQQIEQRTNRQCRLISIVNWDKYQSKRTTKRTTTEQRLNNERTTSEQRLNTNKESKKEKNVNNEKNEKNKKNDNNDKNDKNNIVNHRMRAVNHFREQIGGLT